MPTYEYACKACDHNFEIVQSFSEDTLTTCPQCEQDALRKVYNAAGIIFKGDGWHIKDYASSGPGSRTSSEGDGPSGSGSSDTSSSGEGSSAGATPADKNKKRKKKSGSGSDAAAKPAAS